MKTQSVSVAWIMALVVTGLVLAQPEPSAPAPRGSLLADMKPEKNGQFTIGGVSFTVMHKDEGWGPAFTRDLVVDAGYPQITAESHMVSGRFKTGAGNYAFTQDLRQIDADTVAYKARVKGTPTKGTQVLCLAVTLPIADYRGQKIFFDQESCEVPWWSKGEHLFVLKKGVEQVAAIRIPLKQGGTLVLGGNLRPYFQDVRAYGTESGCLQLAFTPDKGTITNAALDLVVKRVASSDPLAVAFNLDARKPARLKSPPAPPQTLQQDQARIAACLARVRPLPLLRPKGAEFVDPTGQPVRFWGVNVAAFYPEYALADQTADNLASLGINIVRPHHTLRPSGDWAPADCSALVTYQGDSRTPNLKAWDRFDYLNAKLREKGIYLSVTLHGSRLYSPDDVSVLKVSEQDDEAWADAMDEMNHWDWKKAIDPRKMLPVFDERCFRLNAEFATNFLTHVNPYTGIAYGQDPQVISVELVNEFSSEYTLVCGNVFPAYWTQALNARLRAYAQAHGVEPFDLYKAGTQAQRRCFSEFCNALDETYARRMEKIIRETGCEAPIELTNLWRGDANLRVLAKTGGLIEGHAYDDPLIVRDPNNLGCDLVKSAVAGKPYIIGEFNQSENSQLIGQRKPVRTMLPVAIAAYASLQDYAGIIWFAWCHGSRGLGPDGWGLKLAAREPSIGCLAEDGPMLDHFRSAGIIFKNHYLRASVAPQTLVVDDAYTPTTYNEIMSGQSPLQPGWQAVHAFRKAFGPVPPGQAVAPWFRAPPTNPVVSDTGEIVRDAQRKQLTFSAPKAEGLSGYLDGKPMVNLAVLEVPGDAGFATVIAVTLDDAPLAQARKILLSKTFTDAAGRDTSLCPVILRGLAPGAWAITMTRPAPEASLTIASDGAGRLVLPASAWNTCALEWRGQP